MAHNAQTYNGDKPDERGDVSLGIDTITQSYSMTQGTAGNFSNYNFTDGQHFPFIRTTTYARIYEFGVSTLVSLVPITPWGNTHYVRSYVVSGSGTYLLIANAHFLKNGASCTLQWKLDPAVHPAATPFGPKTRHSTATKFANRVCGILTVTGSATVFVEVAEEAGSIIGYGQTLTGGVTYVQMLKIA
jgi:hypothetical protein